MGKQGAPESQVQKFKQAARELECDEDEARWKDKLRQIAGQKDQPKKGRPAK